MQGLYERLDLAGLMPVGPRDAWQPGIVAMHVAGDALIALALFAIPAGMIYLMIRRRSMLPYRGIMQLFCIAILLCALTHALNIWTLWNPNPLLGGLSRLAAGTAAATAAIGLAVALPRMLSLRARRDLVRDLARRTRELEAANDRLRASEENLRLITDSLPVLVSYVDADQRYRFANAAYERWFGLPSEAIIGRRLSDVLGDEAYAVVRASLERVLAGEQVRIQSRIPYRDAGVRDVEIRYVPHRAGGRVLGWVALVEDVAERLHAEQARARLAAVVESTDDAIISKSLDGQVLSWNDAASRMFGYSADEMLGASIMRIVPPELRDEEHRVMQAVRSGLRTSSVDTERLRKDGTRIKTSVTISPILDRYGAIIGASSIARDITDRARAEEALREADRRKDEFLAVLAHELRNPLAPIRSAVHFLGSKQADHPAARNAREIIERQVSHMVRLVDDLLEVSRITRGNIELRKERMTLELAVANAAEAAQPLVEESHHELSVELRDEPLEIDADPTRLTQVLVNVLNNAAKFTPPGGRIALSACREDDDVVVSVRDNGMGIAKSELEQIFELFVQVGPGDRHSRGGLGIGLTLARQIARLHGGDLTAASAGAGRGSEFVLRLPLAPARPPESPDLYEVSSTEAPARRILVVDDNLDAAETVAMLLEDVGHEVRAAHSGAAALDSVAASRPDVVLLDIGLPDIDGYEVARRLRSTFGPGVMRLIALTGWGQDHDRRQASAAGFDEHLTKPVDPSILYAAVAGRSTTPEKPFSTT